MGDQEQHDSFQNFVDAVVSATVKNDDQVVYESPSLGEGIVGREDSMTVDGTMVDLGSYPRRDNPYSFQEHGTDLFRSRSTSNRSNSILRHHADAIGQTGQSLLGIYFGILRTCPMASTSARSLLFHPPAKRNPIACSTILSPFAGVGYQMISRFMLP